MNKKFLSAILFGALMVTSTGTFVSCKDYDDDITNLQEQVDVQKSDLASKVSALESSISSLQSAQSSLDSKIAAAKEAAAKAAADAQAAATAAAADAAAKAEAAATAAAELAAAEAQAAAIAAAQEELAAAKAELVAAIAAAGAEHAADVEELQAALAAAATKHGADIAALNAAIEAAVAGQTADLKALEDAHAAEVLALQSAIATLTANHAADVEGLEAAIAEATEAANVKMAELSGAIQTLQAFAVTTEEALEDLTAADKALQASIAALDTKIAEQAVLVGKNTTAIAAQTEALANYKKALEEYQLANDAAVAGNAEAIAKIEAELAAMKAAADAQAKALNDYIAANNAAVAGNAASIKTNAEAIETLAADIKALQEGQLTEAKVNEIAAQVTKELEGKLDLMSAIYNKMITSVSLVKVLGEDDFTNLALVSSKAVRTWTFGEGMPGAIEFNKGAKETFEQSFVIRVSPSNATVDESTLQLVNSQMGNLDELVDIVSIKPYTGLISRGVSANGLWEVTVKLNEEYDADAYAEASQVKVNGEWEDIVYAVMVGDEDRKVISEYGITLGDQDYHALRTLDFNVDATNVSEIHNRWYGVDNNGPLAKPEMSDDKVPFLEKTWNMDVDADGNEIYSPWDVPTYKDNPNTSKNEINVINDENDKRNLLSAYSVKAGKAFTVNFTDLKEKDKDGNVYKFTDHIRGFYVTLDEECAVESHPSEIRAWEAYDVEGLNEVSTTGSIELTIPEEAGAEGDYIGFRVFAVNYDGSLVDPDGKAFYVYVGETDKGIAELTLSIADKVVIPLEATTTSTKDDFSTAKWGRAQGGKYDLVIKDAAGNVVSVADWTNFKFTYVNEDGDDVEVKLFDDASKLIDSDIITKVTTVEMIKVPASSLKDGMTYTATITAKNTNSGNVAIATVKFAKQLPGFPAYMQPFTGQIVSGNLMVFPYYDATADAALYDMTSSWHGLEKDQDGNTTVTAEKFYHAVSSNQQFTYNSTTNILTAVKGHLNPAANTYLTKWPTNLSYNYGLIRYNYVDEVWAVRNHITYYGDFTMQFGNYVNECKYSMDTNLKIVYPGAIGKTSKFALSKVVIKDWYNAAVSLLKIKEQTTGSKEAKFFARDFKVEFLTGANFDIVNEYYTFDKIANEQYTDADGNKHDNWLIYMTSNSDAATGNPVVTKVRLTFNDKFGNEIVKVVDGSFTMTYQE